MLAGGFVRPCCPGSTGLLPLRGVLPLAVLVPDSRIANMRAITGTYVPKTLNR